MRHFLMAAALLGAAAPAFAAKPWCRPIQGRIVSEYTTENCTSSIGVCTKGRLQADGGLSGATFYTTDAAGPTPKDPTMQASLAYAGKLVLATRFGNLVIEDMGLLDRANGIVSAQGRITEGTGKLAGAYGVLFTYGSATQTGFVAAATGRLCFNK